MKMEVVAAPAERHGGRNLLKATIDFKSRMQHFSTFTTSTHLDNALSQVSPRLLGHRSRRSWHPPASAPHPRHGPCSTSCPAPSNRMHRLHLLDMAPQRKEEDHPAALHSPGHGSTSPDRLGFRGGLVPDAGKHAEAHGFDPCPPRLHGRRQSRGHPSERKYLLKVTQSHN
jgi:hypothetical protein